MIDIPCQMTFNLDFESKIPTKKILDKILDTILNISTRPHLNINAKIVNLDLFNFIMKLKENFVLKLTILNPKPTELLNILSKNFELNFKITNKDYDFSSIRYEFNLILEVENNISNFIKENDNGKIKKIIINHNKNIDYKTFKKAITLIANNKNISKKLYLTPYLEENEQEKFYNSKEQIRPFLTCAALWFNPIINARGEVSLPCFCSKRSILEMEFFDIWNDGDINTVREELINKKQFYGCKYCEQFYKSNFLVVEDNIIKYKNNKFHFENTLNPILSAPFVGIIKKDNICIPVPLFDDNQTQELHKNENLVLILK